MKVKVINKNTNQQFDCEEIEINGFKYYIIDTAIGCKYGISKLNQVVEIKIGYDAALYKGIICSNNPNIDIPKVVDEVELILDLLYPKIQSGNYGFRRREDFRELFAQGYNKSQETPPFSLNDLKSLLDFITNEKTEYSIMYGNQEERFSTIDKDFTIDELINIWKEQQPKIVYYEKQG